MVAHQGEGVHSLGSVASRGLQRACGGGGREASLLSLDRMKEKQKSMLAWIMILFLKKRTLILYTAGFLNILCLPCKSKA